MTTTKLDNITRLPDVQVPKSRIFLGEAEFEQALFTYLEQNKTSNAIVARDDPTDIKQFFSLVKEAIETRQDTEGVPVEKRILFLEDDPPETLDTEAITFFINRRIPGQFNQGPAGDGRIKEVSRHVRAIVDHPLHPGEKLVTLGRFYDNWVTFGIFAKTNKVALDRLIWFEHVMDSFNWFFRLHGFRVIEEGAGNRERIILDELPLTHYPVTYMVRLDDVFHYSTQELRSLVVTANVDTQRRQ